MISLPEGLPISCQTAYCEMSAFDPTRPLYGWRQSIYSYGPGQDRLSFRDVRLAGVIRKSVQIYPGSLGLVCRRQGRSNEGGVSVTKKPDDRSWIERSVHRWRSCDAVVCGYRSAQRNWKHSC